MEKTGAIFSTFADADEGDAAQYAQISPSARVEILLELIARHREATGEAATGFARIYRIAELAAD